MLEYMTSLLPAIGFAFGMTLVIDFTSYGVFKVISLLNITNF